MLWQCVWSGASCNYYLNKTYVVWAKKFWGHGELNPGLLDQRQACYQCRQRAKPSGECSRHTSHLVTSSPPFPCIAHNAGCLPVGSLEMRRYPSTTRYPSSNLRLYLALPDQHPTSDTKCEPRNSGDTGNWTPASWIRGKHATNVAKELSPVASVVDTQATWSHQ